MVESEVWIAGTFRLELIRNIQLESDQNIRLSTIKFLTPDRMVSGVHVYDPLLSFNAHNQSRGIMNIQKHKLTLAGIILSLASANLEVNAAETAIEWAPFIKAVGVSDEQLISAANLVNADFLIKQKGFIKRELIKKNEEEYADVVYWRTKIDAVTAGEKVNACAKCGDYFKLMNMGEKAGEGFSHYIIIKSWKH